MYILASRQCTSKNTDNLRQKWVDEVIDQEKGHQMSCISTGQAASWQRTLKAFSSIYIHRHVLSWTNLSSVNWTSPPSLTPQSDWVQSIQTLIDFIICSLRITAGFSEPSCQRRLLLARHSGFYLQIMAEWDLTMQWADKAWQKPQATRFIKPSQPVIFQKSSIKFG